VGLEAGPGAGHGAAGHGAVAQVCRREGGKPRSGEAGKVPGAPSCCWGRVTTKGLHSLSCLAKVILALAPGQKEVMPDPQGVLSVIMKLRGLAMRGCV
jgi:hypothetical protein